MRTVGHSVFRQIAQGNGWNMITVISAMHAYWDEEQNQNDFQSIDRKFKENWLYTSPSLLSHKAEGVKTKTHKKAV